MLSSWLFALQYPWLYECFSSKIIRSVRVVNPDRDCRFALKWKIIPMQQLACLHVLHSQRQLNRSSSCHTWSWQVPDGWETSVNGFGSNHVVVLQDNICVQPRGTTQIWCAPPYTLQMAKCNKPSRAVLQPDVHFLSRSFFSQHLPSLLWLLFLHIPVLGPDVRLSRVLLSVRMLQLVIPSRQLDNTTQVCEGVCWSCPV